MEGAVIFALILLTTGSLLSWAAIMGWRYRKEEMTSLLEAAIWKTTGVEPLPVNRLGRWFQRFQLVLISVLGPALLMVGVWGLLTELGVL